MDINVTKQWKNTDTVSGKSSTYITQASATTNTTKDVVIPFPDSVELQFHFTNAPSVENYNIDYAPVYGKYPKILLLIYDDNDDLLEADQRPKRIMTDGLLTGFIWDLPVEMSGLIIISK